MDDLPAEPLDPPFRFSILRLLVLITTAAVLVVYVRSLDVVWPFKLVVFAYLAALAGWAVFRLPAVIRSFIAFRRKLKRFRQRRSELEQQYGKSSRDASERS